MKKTFCAALALVAVLLFTGNIFAQENNAKKYIAQFFGTENIAERTKIVDEAIEKLPIEESTTLIFMDTVGNYIIPFIDKFYVAKTPEDFAKIDSLAAFVNRLNEKAIEHSHNIDKLQNAEGNEVMALLAKVETQEKVLKKYLDIYKPIQNLFKENAFEIATNEIYADIFLYNGMQGAATGKAMEKLPSDEEFKAKLKEQIELSEKLTPKIQILREQKVIKQLNEPQIKHPVYGEYMMKNNSKIKKYTEEELKEMAKSVRQQQLENGLKDLEKSDTISPMKK